MKFNSSIFLSLESRDQWTVMLRKFYWPLLLSPNPREKFFFYQNFSTNQILRKNEIQFFDFFLIGIERWANTDAEKVLLIFVVFSKSAGKIFFLSKFFDQSDFEKKSNSILHFFSHWNREIGEQWCWKNSIDLRCILQIRQNKFFFSHNFWTNQILRQNEIQFFEFFVIGIERSVNSDAEKILLTFVVFSKSARKNFFFLKYFQPIRISRKNQTQFLDFFLVGIEWLLNSDAEKILLTFVVFSKSAGKIFFFYQNFSTNQIWRKNQIQFFDFFLIGIERWPNTDAEKVLLIFVVFSKSARQNFFFIKIFQPIGFREKIKFNSSTFSPLESTEEWTLMRRKLFLFSWNPCFPGEAMKNMYCSLFCSNFYFF